MNTTTLDNDNHRPIGYGELVRKNRNFRYLWFGEIISLLGDWFNLIASATLVAQLTQSGLAIGTLFVIRTLAPFLVSPIAGVVADRYNRKQILILTDITRALVVFCFIFVVDASDVWLLYTLTALQLGISGFFFPTRNAILPDVTTKRELGAANALSSATWSVMLALGAAIGGIVSGTWGIYSAFVIDGVSFLLSALFIVQIQLDTAPGLDPSDKTVAAALRQYIDGLGYLAEHLNIFVIALHKAAVSLLFGTTFMIVQVAIAEKVFVIGEGGGISLGLMFALTGIGTGLGPILARYLTGDSERLLRLAIFFGYFIAGLGIVILAPLFSFGSVLFGTILRGVGSGIIWVFSSQLLLQMVPNRVRGRVFATEFALFSLMGAIGAALIGRALDLLGISGVAWWMAALSLLPAILWALWMMVDKSSSSDS